MLRFVAAILLGGGALGAFTGWAITTFLEAKRHQLVARVAGLASPHSHSDPPPATATTITNQPGAVVDITPQDFIDPNRPHLITDPTVWRVSEAERRAIEGDPAVREWLASNREANRKLEELFSFPEEEDSNQS